MREHFLLDPSVIFLNHGSFGACPAPVFAAYQEWQRDVERQPVDFFINRSDDLLDAAREKIGDYINAPANELIFVPNATIGLNTVIRSLSLAPGDEILTTTHEYGALDLTWQFLTEKTGAKVVRAALQPPYNDTGAFVDAFMDAVTERTRVIFISHYTSPTALIFPVAEICRRARERGILTIVDGAHVPGHIPLDIAAIDADFYSGNFHKWLCAPKGSAFLHARTEHHPMIDPLVISWGWGHDASFVQRNQWQGTRELSAFLTVPAAIDFQAQHNWDVHRARCHRLAAQLHDRLCTHFGLQPLSTGSHDWFAQMVSVPLPACNAADVKRCLIDDFRIEVPLTRYDERDFIRISFQAYNTQADADALFNALCEIFASA